MTTQNDYGGWLQWMDGEGGPANAQLGAKGGMVTMFDPAILAKYGFGSTDGLTMEQLAQMGQASGLDYQVGERGDGGTWVNLMHNGQATGDKAWAQDTPTSAMDTILPLMFAAATGGALGFYDLPSFLTGGGLGGAGAGGEIAGLAADQIGALAGAAEGATAGDAFAAAAQAALEGSGNYYMLNPAAQAAFDAASIAGLGEAATSLAPFVSSSAEKAALYGAEGYGPGMTGAETFGYDKVLDWTGSKVLADILGPTAGSALDALAPIAKPGLWDTVKSGVGTVADAVGGGKNLAGLIGAVAGAAEGGGTDTHTLEKRLDPRMQEMLYGNGIGDANSVFGAARNLWQQNPTGINPTMQQGMDMQKAALTDPAYSQGYQAMRTAGMGLLGQGVAANPFTSGQASTQGLLNMGQPTAQAGGTGGLLNVDPDAANRLIKVGRGLLPNSI